MAQEQATQIAVGSNDTIETVIERIAASGAREVRLRLPQSVSVLTSLPDFEKLRTLERSSGVRLTIVTDANDKSRSGLARILGFQIVKEGERDITAQRATLDDTSRLAELAAATPPPAVARPSPAPAISRPPVSTPPAVEPPRPQPTVAQLDEPVDVREAGMNDGFSFTPAATAATPDAAGRQPEVVAAIDELVSRPVAPRPASREENGSRPKMLGGEATTRARRTGDVALPPASPTPAARPPAARDRVEQARRQGRTGDVPRNPTPPAAAAVAATAIPPANTPTVEVQRGSRNKQAPAMNKAVAAGALAAGAIPLTEPRPRPRPERVATERRSGSRGLLYTALALLLLLAGGVGAGLWWFSNQYTPPSATVLLTPRQTTITQTIVVPIQINPPAISYRAAGLLAPLAQDALTTTVPLPAPDLPTEVNAPPVQAQLIEATISASDTVQATGSREERRGNDVTRLQLTNRNGGAANIPSGTQVQASNGTVFVFTNNVTVPGTDFVNLTFGVATVDVRANPQGPTGVRAGTVNGVIGSVQYFNTNNASGGTMAQVPVVAQADYDSLLGALTDRLNREALPAVEAQVAPDQTFIKETYVVNPPAAPTTNLQVGQDGASLTMQLSLTARANAFRPAEAATAAQAVVAPSFANSPVDLDPASVAMGAGEFQVVAQPEGQQFVYRTLATASLTYRVSDQIKNEVLQMIREQQADVLAQATAQADLQQRILSRYASYVSAVKVSASPAAGGFDPQQSLNQEGVKVEVKVADPNAATPTPAPLIPGPDIAATPTAGEPAAPSEEATSTPINLAPADAIATPGQ